MTRRLEVIRPELVREVERLYREEGLSRVDIAKKLGIGRSKVRQFLKRSGVPSIKIWNKGFSEGTKRHNTKGYIEVKSPDHPKANPRGWVAEHLLVWEETNKQSLPEGWHIHHLNGIRDDNRSENLLALPATEHTKLISNLQQRIRKLEIQVSRDLLTSLFETQRSLMEKYKDIESRTGLLPTRKIPVNLATYKGQERIRQSMWNIVAELGEFAEGLNYRAWKTNPQPPDINYLYNEIGDLIHFVLEFLILSGITPENIGEIYFKMVDKNRSRQDSGY